MNMNKSVHTYMYSWPSFPQTNCHQVWLSFSWPRLYSKRQPTTESSVWHKRSHHPGPEGYQIYQRIPALSGNMW